MNYDNTLTTDGGRTSCPHGGVPGVTLDGDDPYAIDPRVAKSMLRNAAECGELDRDTVTDELALADGCDAYDAAEVRRHGIDVPGRPVRTLVGA